MTLDQYMVEWAKDAPIPKDNLDETGRQVPYLHAKYYRFLSDARLHLKKLDLEYKVLYKNKYEYFNGKMLDEDRNKLKWPIWNRKILPAQINQYIDADPDVQTLQRQRAVLDEAVSFLIDVLKHINGRGYLIHNILDFMRFSMGT